MVPAAVRQGHGVGARGGLGGWTTLYLEAAVVVAAHLLCLYTLHWGPTWPRRVRWGCHCGVRLKCDARRGPEGPSAECRHAQRGGHVLLLLCRWLGLYCWRQLRCLHRWQQQLLVRRQRRDGQQALEIPTHSQSWRCWCCWQHRCLCRLLLGRRHKPRRPAQLAWGHPSLACWRGPLLRAHQHVAAAAQPAGPSQGGQARLCRRHRCWRRRWAGLLPCWCRLLPRCLQRLVSVAIRLAVHTHGAVLSAVVTGAHMPPVAARMRALQGLRPQRRRDSATVDVGVVCLLPHTGTPTGSGTHPAPPPPAVLQLLELPPHPPARRQPPPPAPWRPAQRQQPARRPSVLHAPPPLW